MFQSDICCYAELEFIIIAKRKIEKSLGQRNSELFLTAIVAFLLNV
mgnify:CR=1 FL=1